jgi:transcriptional regulator with XRE-family HTH domain
VVNHDDERLLASVGRRIGELRAQAGLTQAEAAERFGTAVSNWQRIEHGLQNLTLVTMRRIARALGVEIAALLKAPQTKRAPPGRPRKRG